MKIQNIKNAHGFSPFLPALSPRTSFHLLRDLHQGEPFIQHFLRHSYGIVIVGSTWDFAHYVISYSSQKSLYLLFGPGAFVISWMTEQAQKQHSIV